MSKKLLGFWVSAFILFSLLMPQTSLAAPQINIEAEAGIQNKVKYEKGLPVRFTLENNGPAFSGDLVINYSESYELGAGLAVPVELAAGESKTMQIALPGLMDAYAVNGMQAQTIFLYEGGWEDGKSVPFTGPKSLKANFFSPGSMFIATLTDNSDRLIALKEINSPTNESVQVFHLNQLQQFNLPSDAVAWEFFDYLVIDEYAYGDLPEAVQLAILQWMREGGHILTGSTENMDSAMGNLSDYLPLQLGAPESIDIPAFNNTVPAFEAELTDGAKALMEENGEVVAARMQVGSGSLTQTSFSIGDEPVVSQEGYFAVLDGFFNNSSQANSPMYSHQPLIERMSYEVGSVNELFESFAVSKVLVMAIIFFYIILVVPVLYTILKKKDKREYAWFVIPVTAVFVSIGLFAIGAKDRIAKPQIQQAGFFIADSTGSLNGYYMNTLLSNRGGNYQFTAPPATSMIYRQSEGLMQQSMEQTAIFEQKANGNALTVRDMRYWSVGSVMGESYIENTGNFEILLTMENKTLTGTVKNNFPFALDDVSIWTGTRLIGLGDLAPGEQLNVNAKIQGDILAPAAEISSAYGHQPIADAEELQKARKQSVLAVSYSEINDTEKAPYVTGYTQDAIVPISLEGQRADVSAVHLIAQPFEPDLKLSGEISLDSDAFHHQLNGIAAMSYFEQISTDPYLYFLEDGKYELTYQLPELPATSKTSWNELTVINASPGLSTVLMQAENGKSLALTDKQTVISESVSDYIAENGTITFQLEMDASGGPPEVTIPKIKLKGEVTP